MKHKWAWMAAVRMARVLVAAALLAGVATWSAAPLRAQPAPARTLEELKAEAQARADRGSYPLIGLKPDDVREALGRLKSLDRDEWAASWSVVGDRYMVKARAEAAALRKDADGDFLMAWRYYSFARWPVPASPGKQRAYAKALEAFVSHGQLLDPPMQVAHIPFEGKEIVAYLQLPKGGAPAPLIVAIGGLDSRKEDMAERFRPLLAHGIGSLCLDGPGTGQAPIKVAPGAERMLRHAMDWALQRPDVDKSRVAIYGGSFGGYWATLLAVTDRERLRAVVAQSPPIHETFQPEALRVSLANREYLFDLVPALMTIFDNVETVEQLTPMWAHSSLQAQGFIGKPMAPLLVIAGVKDTQVSIADIDLLLHTGSTPKEAWINPNGGHMGREARGWTDPVIFRKITMPWLIRMLQDKAE